MNNCKFCRTPIPEDDVTSMCDNCWEVNKRVGKQMPIKVLNKIVADARGYYTKAVSVELKEAGRKKDDG